MKKKLFTQSGMIGVKQKKRVKSKKEGQLAAGLEKKKIPKYVGEERKGRGGELIQLSLKRGGGRKGELWYLRVRGKKGLEWSGGYYAVST